MTLTTVARRPRRPQRPGDPLAAPRPDRDKAADHPAPSHAEIRAVGTATPVASYGQEELLDRFDIRDPKVRSVFRNSAIERRFLTLPEPAQHGGPCVETQGELLAKHRSQGIAMGTSAVRACLARAGADPADVAYICAVTTTGLLTPGFSALLSRALALSHTTGRLDVTGMGCNAGLNALGAVAGWARANPGKLALMVCVEVCSAAYVFDGTMRSAVVNSLFGDGAAAVAIVAGAAGDRPRPPEAVAAIPAARVLGFASCLIPDSIDAMRYDWDDDHGKFSFFLDRDVPYVVGAHAEEVLGRLLGSAGLLRRDIAHWVVHSGGKKVIDAVKINLGLTGHDLRHTTAVLRDYGNLSSGSFLFSYERLMDEGVVQPGDRGVLMTMGPGSTIEMALVRW